MSAAIELVGVSKQFESRGGRVHALDDLTLQVRPREFLCVIGASGCGKSTILNLVAGIGKPSAGRVEVNGGSVESAIAAHQIGLVFQDAVLLPWRTVRENAELPLEILKFPHAERRRLAQDALAMVRLGGFEDKFPHELSGGMRQRAAICRALIANPALLLMDEPFSALDAITREKMNLELQQVWERERKTVVFVTHSISEAVLLSDRIAVMTPRPGRLRSLIDNPLPRPRSFAMQEDAAFVSLSRRLRELLEAQ